MAWYIVHHHWNIRVLGRHNYSNHQFPPLYLIIQLISFSFFFFVYFHFIHSLTPQATHFIVQESFNLYVRSSGQMLSVRYGLFRTLSSLVAVCVFSCMAVMIAWWYELRHISSYSRDVAAIDDHRRGRDTIARQWSLPSTPVPEDHPWFLRHLESMGDKRNAAAEGTIRQRQQFRFGHSPDAVSVVEASEGRGDSSGDNNREGERRAVRRGHVEEEEQMAKRNIRQCSTPASSVDTALVQSPQYQNRGSNRGDSSGMMDDENDDSRDMDELANHSITSEKLSWRDLKSSIFSHRMECGRYRPGILRLLIASLIFATGFALLQYIGAQGSEVENVEIETCTATIVFSWLITFIAVFAAMIAMVFVKHHGFMTPMIFSAGVIMGDLFTAVNNRYSIDMSEVPWTRPMALALTRYNLVLTVAMSTFALCFATIVGISKLVVNQQNRFMSVMEILYEEKRKTDHLLNSIMPRRIAMRIKRGEKNINESHDAVTVIFIDIANFTMISDGMDRHFIMHMLHTIFSGFDNLAKKHGVTKVKLVGDAWMGASGLSYKCDDHAARAVRFGIDAMQVVKAYNAQHEDDLAWPYVQIKIGMSSGRCISGIIGHQVYHYDIWGPCVNLASRMECLCPEPNCIQISESTFLSLVRYVRLCQALKNQGADQSGGQERDTRTVSTSYALRDIKVTTIPIEKLPTFFRERGTIQVKGKGAMKTYVCLLMTGNERIRDQEFSDAQQRRLQATLTESDYAVMAMDDEGADIVRTNMMHQESKNNSSSSNSSSIIEPNLSMPCQLEEKSRGDMSEQIEREQDHE